MGSSVLLLLNSLHLMFTMIQVILGSVHIIEAVTDSGFQIHSANEAISYFSDFTEP